MAENTNLETEMAWFRECVAKKAVTRLEERNINAEYVTTRQEALSVLLDSIPPRAVVARGDSLTLDQIGILSALRERGQNTLIDPFGIDAEGRWLAGTDEGHQMKRESFLADVFLTGTNALTIDGELVNVDGVGGRVAAMIFGPNKVIVVAGVNKIVKDVDSALRRIREFAAPINAKRHLLRHQATQLADLPCIKSGTCVDCRHDWRICHYTVIIEGVRLSERGRIRVVLVGEELGI